MLPLSSSKLYLKLRHAVWDPAKAFFGIPAADAPQEQSARSCWRQQYTFTVLSQRYPHSPTICYGLVAQCLEDFNTFTHHKLLSYADGVICITGGTAGPTEQEAGEALSNVSGTMQNHGWEINPEKIQRAATEVKFGRIIWQGLCRMMPKTTKETIFYMAEMQSKVETQKIIGLSGFQKQFIPYLAQILRSLYNTVRKKWSVLPRRKLKRAALEQEKKAVSLLQ